MSPRFGIFGGASYRRAVTNLIHTAGFAPLRATVSTTSATADAGLLFFLTSGTAREASSDASRTDEG